MIFKTSVPRRTFIRGAGVLLGLPLLDAMVPALTALAKTAANPVRRFGAVYVPNGMAMEYWTPATEGAAFTLTPILEPLAPFRDSLLVISGLDGPPGANHAGASTRFLTGAVGEDTEAGFNVGISIDQIAAREFGKETQLASLELALDGRENLGTCEPGYSCALTNTISWRTPSTPLPMENNPRVVFERLFGDSGSTDPTARAARLRRQRSILDSVTETVADLKRELGRNDVGRISEYLEAVRDVERRIQKVEEQSAIEMPVVAQPAGVPASFEEHANLMFDLQLLAYQSDLTRSITFMFGREFSARSYPEVGVSEGHHPLSHHQYHNEKIARLAKVNTYHATLLAYYLERLGSTVDGDGSLLDHTLLIYGAGISDSNAHDNKNLPLVLLGGGIQGGRHLQHDGDPLGDLLVAVTEKLGVPEEQIGNSRGRLPLDRLAGI